MILAVVLAVLAFATPAIAKDRVGGDYFVTTYKGLPGGTPFRITQEDWDILAYADRLCRGDLKAQRPSGISEVFHTTVVGALGAGGGYAAGYGATDMGVSAGKAAQLGGLVGAVSGFVNGIDGRGRAKRYGLGQCMAHQVNWIQRFEGRLGHVAILMNAHAVSGKKIRRPDAGVQNPTRGAVSESAPSGASPQVIPPGS